RFEGNLEVAGQMADVIIANPSGINIKGGGFINANKAIFTTGKPQLNADGSIQQFNVSQGKVTITAPTNSILGLGGNNNNANYVDIYARAL
ncbi:filamentous hemagglutinin N-terminal domain-containing protein, partial [Acinetobacter baumannii]